MYLIYSIPDLHVSVNSVPKMEILKSQSLISPRLFVLTFNISVHNPSVFVTKTSCRLVSGRIGCTLDSDVPSVYESLP